MLAEKGLKFRYREYRKDPLDAEELRRLLAKLDVPARAVLRSNDRAYKELGLDGGEPDEVLIEHLAAHPTLLQRPIGVLGARAVIGRPVERLLELE